MKYCTTCGEKITPNTKHCTECGKAVNPSQRSKYLFVFPVFAVLLIIASIFGYSNYTSKQEIKSQISATEAAKITQQKADEEFALTQQQKAEQLARLQEQINQQDNDVITRQKQAIQSIQQVEQAAQSKDEDEDGLTYAQESALGTSDNNPDSDLDGILDNEDNHPAGGGEVYKFSIPWAHNGNSYVISFGIPEDRYWYYRNKKDRNSCCGDWGKYATYSDQVIQTIAEDISDIGITNEYQGVQMVIDFVNSMTYQLDIDFNGNGEFPKYPIETIVDKRGDCEDTSFLMASLLRALNYDVVLVQLPGHMATAVACTDCAGAYYIHRDRKFFYLETTGNPGEFAIGQMPEEYLTAPATIIEVTG